MRSFIARSTIFLSRVLGPKGLNFARQSLPLGFKRRLSRIVTHSLPQEQSVIRSGDGHQFVTLNEPVFLHLRMEGYYERALSDIARAVVQPGDNTVDVGANFGWYSVLMASRVGPHGKVYSFEPNAKMFTVLSQNLELNGYGDRVNSMQIGIGSEESVATLEAEATESAVGYVVLNKDPDQPRRTGNQIEIKPLDSLLSQVIGDIAFVKVDVEGFEPHVLAGGRSIFQSDNPPVLQLELNTEALNRQGTDIAGFVTALNSLPAQIFRGESGRLKKIEAVPVGEDADLFFFPRYGKFADRIKLVSARL
jgi:FkbM family methyltransferase